MFDHSKFYYFYQITPTPGEYSFGSYADGQTGTTWKAIQSTDPSGKDRSFYIKFSARERFYRFPKEQKIQVRVNGDTIKKMSVYDYVKNFPGTEGSPYSYGTKPIIKEFDENKDAAVGVNRKKRRLDAANIVIGLSNVDRAALAPLIGVFNENPDVQLNRLLEFADQDPESFFKIYEAPDKDIRSLVTQAIKATVISRQGKALILEFEKGQKKVYADEDDLVSALLKDESLLQALKINTSKIK